MRSPLGVARHWPSWRSCGRCVIRAMTSVVIGASSVKQLDDNVAALGNMSLTSDELAEIDQYAVEADINLWKNSSDQ